MNSNKFSPSRSLSGVFLFNLIRLNLSKVLVNPDNEEPYPSLSDYHDYEPNLEFDDSELHQSPNVVAQTGMFFKQSNKQ